MMRGQVSIEFIILFTAALLLFILAASFFPDQLKGASDIEQQSQQVLDEIKLHTIAASIAEQDYEAVIPVPTSLAGEQVLLEVLPNPDNVAFIKKTLDDVVVGRVILPVVSSVTYNSPVSGHMIIQKEGNTISVMLP